jgi:hypothetical protein
MNKKHTPGIITHSVALMAAACVCNLASCSNSSHLLLYQQSNLGLNAGVNPSTQNIHVRVGLRREFGAIVPKYTIDKDGKATNQAASAYFGSRARVKSPFRVPEVAEVMATGPAAVIAASAGNALDFADPSKPASPETVTDPNTGNGTGGGTSNPPVVNGPIPPAEEP